MTTRKRRSEIEMASLILQYGKIFEQELHNFITMHYEGEMEEILKYALLGDGKRLRPGIMLTLARDLSLDEKIILPAALGIELIHNYSLVQDDLPSFDNDEFRRGKPTLHRKYGEYKAILASDIMVTDGISLFHLLPSSGKISGLVRHAAGYKGLIMGQYKDMEITFKNKEALYEMYVQKTGKLFEISFSIPFIVAELDHEELQAKSIAKAFGIAFQLHNDLKRQEGENKGILKLMSRKDALLEYNKYMSKAQNIFELIRGSETRMYFKEIWDLLGGIHGNS